MKVDPYHTYVVYCSLIGVKPMPVEKWAIASTVVPERLPVSPVHGTAMDCFGKRLKG